MKLLIFSFFFLISISVFTQVFRNVEHYQFKVRLFSPGFEFEKGLGNNTTLNLGASVQLAARKGQDLVYWGIVPATNLAFRYYTNFDRRIVHDKYIFGNSANYVGLVNNLYYAMRLIEGAEIAGENGFFGNVGVVYGLQRTWLIGFNFDVSAGLGYYYDANYDASFGPIGRIAIGWAF